MCGNWREGPLTDPVFWETGAGPGPGRQGRLLGKLSVACCFSNKVAVIGHYHNSSWLEHGASSQEKTTNPPLSSAIDAWLRQNNKYQKNESRITWADIEGYLVLVSNNFSTRPAENQTKKAINLTGLCRRP